MRLLRLIGAIRLSKFKWGHAFWKMNGEYIKRYRTCNTAEEVMAMQDLIQKEMVDDRIQRKARQGKFVFLSVFFLFDPDAADYDDGDLLQANPNHVGEGWDDEQGEEVSDESDDVEALGLGVARIVTVEGS